MKSMFLKLKIFVGFQITNQFLPCNTGELPPTKVLR